MQDKAYLREISILADSGLFERVLCVTVDSHRAETADRIAGEFMAAGMDAVAVSGAAEALRAARDYVREDGKYAYITGSLYLVGEMRGFSDDRF